MDQKRMLEVKKLTEGSRSPFETLLVAQEEMTRLVTAELRRVTWEDLAAAKVPLDRLLETLVEQRGVLKLLRDKAIGLQQQQQEQNPPAMTEAEQQRRAESFERQAEHVDRQVTTLTSGPLVPPPESPSESPKPEPT